jgi:hypothetical protein
LFNYIPNNSKKNQDAILIGCPYLIPTLIIENNDTDGFNYYYHIKNNGLSTAQNVHFQAWDDFHSTFEFIPPGNNAISENSEFKFQDHIMKFPKELIKRNNFFYLNISYDLTIGNEKRTFQNFYYFYISQDKISNGKYLFSHSNISQYGIDELINPLQLFMPNADTIYDKKHAGFSINLLMSVDEKNIGQEDKYIFDAGRNADISRISVYFNKEGNLVFRVLDCDGNSFDAVLEKKDFIGFGKYVYLDCECIKLDHCFLLNIFQNGKLSNKELYAANLDMNVIDARNVAYLGCNISKSNNCTFSCYYASLEYSSQTDSIRTEINNKFINKPFIIGLLYGQMRYNFLNKQLEWDEVE